MMLACLMVGGLIKTHHKKCESYRVVYYAVQLALLYIKLALCWHHCALY